MENARKRHMNYCMACMKRCFLSKRFCIELFLTFILGMTSMPMLNAVWQTARIMPQKYFDAIRFGNTYNIGILTVSRLDIVNAPTRDSILTGVLSGSFTLGILALFISTFLSSEHKNGYLLASVAHGQKRSMLYLQYLVTAVTAAVLFCAAATAGVITSVIVYSSFVLENAAETIRIMLLQTGLIILSSLCFACISVIVKGRAAAALCISAVFAFPLIPVYFRMFTGMDLNLDRYFLFCILMHSAEIPPSDTAVPVICSLMTSFVLCTASLLVFRKQNLN